MSFDKFMDFETLQEERRHAVQESVRPINIDELKNVAKQHPDEFQGDPWRDKFLRLIAEQPHATFYRAVPQDDAEVFYCHEADFGIWVIPGSGMGPLDATGKRLMKEAIEGSFSGQKIGGKK